MPVSRHARWHLALPGSWPHGCTIEDVNDQPPRLQPAQHGAVSTRLAAHPIPPGAGAPGWRLWAATAARLLLAAVWA
jgi:hypothetical protein